MIDKTVNMFSQLSDTIYWELRGIRDDLDTIVILLIIMIVLLCFIVALLILMVRWWAKC